jgi:hypothetical protein
MSDSDIVWETQRNDRVPPDTARVVFNGEQSLDVVKRAVSERKGVLKSVKRDDLKFYIGIFRKQVGVTTDEMLRLIPDGESLDRLNTVLSDLLSQCSSERFLGGDNVKRHAGKLDGLVRFNNETVRKVHLNAIIELSKGFAFQSRIIEDGLPVVLLGELLRVKGLDKLDSKTSSNRDRCWRKVEELVADDDELSTSIEKYERICDLLRIRRRHLALHTWAYMNIYRNLAPRWSWDDRMELVDVKPVRVIARQRGQFFRIVGNPNN